MPLSQLVYFLQTALGAIKRAPSMALLSALSVSMVLVMMGTWAMAVYNLERLTLVWGRAASLSCALEPSLEPASYQSIVAQIARLDGIKEVTLVTPQAALARFAARSAEAQALVDGVDPSILPASLEMRLEAGSVEIGHLQALADKIGGIAGVASIDFGAEVMGRLRRLVHLLRWGGVGIGALLAGATVFLLSNTIRLTVYARRDEIVILRLVGATPSFVRTPFLLEGALWGLGGGVMASGGLYGLHGLVALRLSRLLSALTGGYELSLYRPSMAVSLACAGMVLGASCSALALRRFLDAEFA